MEINEHDMEMEIGGERFVQFVDMIDEHLNDESLFADNLLTDEFSSQEILQFAVEMTKEFFLRA